jgi:hypothetical protein
MKVAVYAICGASEEKHVERFWKSCEGADEICVAMTADLDGDSANALFDLGAALVPALVMPFRFDDARNTALASVPQDTDICIALDMDETLEPGWRDALEEYLPKKPWKNPLAWWIDFDFNGEIFRQNNRVHSRHGWRWKHPCHEALMPSMQRQTDAVETVPGFKITHRPDLSKPRPNYLELLAWGQWEDPTNLRMLHYYGRELMFHGFYKDAAERFELYLALAPEDHFPMERSATQEYLVQCRSRFGNPVHADRS